MGHCWVVVSLRDEPAAMKVPSSKVSNFGTRTAWTQCPPWAATCAAPALPLGRGAAG
eukprot:CAMPEP_0171111498 /NCGR_PEP_ID=MMETSP0766_2-20121228/75262_1 /TAXON_ID=439317 /ORGANISM="Gambierdiscus australes, Strain CAWD 149" /LENGTH=56 /DNA_ID=CAMNT_0011573491 /DNA_START=21 /DNA_END=188 /DNA_ORIENTATION=+